MLDQIQYYSWEEILYDRVKYQEEMNRRAQNMAEILGIDLNQTPSVLRYSVIANAHTVNMEIHPYQVYDQTNARIGHTWVWTLGARAGHYRYHFVNEQDRVFFVLSCPDDHHKNI